jgi:bifunctional UDP-N-acetylglucosamine pyrophosphorylase/glucosamine-1-phosphate N-acetyltransferase
MKNLWPIESALSTLPIAGKALSSWVQEGVLSEQELEAIVYPWELLDFHERLLQQVLEGASDFREDRVAQLAEGARLFVGEGTQVLPGVYVEGVVVVGKDCKIGPNCYLRGPISIGDHCHVGQGVELKNTILGNGTNVGHLSYIGDSILANKVNLGAGTITSNLRHDGKNHRSQVAGQIVDTGRRKFGTIVGDNVHTGIHTSLYPGRKLGPHTTTLPGEVVSKDKS